jgi:hypothetical protein
VLSDSPITFTISIKSETYEEGGEEGLTCTLKFTFTPNYPEDVPEIEIINDEEDENNEDNSNLEPNDILDLTEMLLQQVNI